MRDMIPPGDRSIRNIPIPKGHRHIPQEELAPEADSYRQEAEPLEAAPRAPRARRRRRPGRFLFLALIVILVCAGGVAAVSMLYAGATVKAKPRTETVSTASTTLVAQTNAPVGTLSLTMISSTHWATTTVPATGTKRVSRQATGVVTISSTYSASQRLVTGTRLQAPDGKIYKTTSSITLPAGGKETVPVNAESAGESYNRGGTTTFTLPGFAGDPRFSVFSAKSEGAISGGFIGDEPAVAASDLAVAEAELKAKLDNATSQGLAQSIPTGSAAVPGTMQVTYGEPVQTASADKKSATISRSATAQGATVGVRDLASALARKLVEDYKGEAVDFQDQGTLTMTASTTNAAEESVALLLSGDTTLVWQFDPNALKQAILGKDKGQFQAIVESFAPAITSATATIRPFWIKNFPSDPEKIKIEVEGDK